LLFLCFFFLMTQLPPGSDLFPYTRSSDLVARCMTILSGKSAPAKKK